MTDPAVTYASYLKVDELLALQQPRSQGPEHDELLFIVIHQVYELWFKELLHEFDRARQWLEDDEPHRAQHTLKRILSVLKVMVAQLDILETMTPLEFLSFRERLEAASGFQSDQFRQIEFVLGVKSEGAIRRFPDGSRARAALERRYREPTLWDAFLHYLSREGYASTDHASRAGCVCADRTVAGGAADPRRRVSRTTRRTRSCASGWSISTKGSRSGATGTPRWSSGRLARSVERAARAARRTCGKRLAGRCSRISGRSGRSCERA